MTRSERLALAREGIAQFALCRDNLLTAVMIGLGLAGKRPLARVHLIGETAKEGSGFQTLLGTAYALAAGTVVYVAQPSEEAKLNGEPLIDELSGFLIPSPRKRRGDLYALQPFAREHARARTVITRTDASDQPAARALAASGYAHRFSWDDGLRRRPHAFGIPQATWEALEAHIFPHLANDPA